MPSLEKTCKIVLIFPNFRGNEKFNVTPHLAPLGLGYLAAMLKKNNIPYRIIDAAASKISQDTLVQMIEEINPEFVGLSMNVTTSYSGILSAIKIKRRFPDIKILMGGPWAHANFENILHKKIADIVFFGEGEYSIVKLMEAGKDQEKYNQIRGMAYLKDGKIVKTEPNSPIENLDEIPHPTWEQFPIKHYDAIHRAKPFFPIMTIRGCPYDCINCTKIIHGYKPRFRSIENIIEELDYLKKEFNAKEIIIEDDIFNIDLARAKRLLLEIIKRNYSFKIQMANGIRADKIDKEFAHLLKRAGCYKVAIGIESGSPSVIRFLQKKLDLNVVKNAVRILRSEKIVVYGYFILGLPIETINSMIYSIDFADKIDLDVANFFKIIVFPGTKMYDYIINHNGKQMEDLTLKSVNYHTMELSFTPANFTQRDFDKAYLYYLIRFFLNPRRMVRFILTLNPAEMLYFVRRIISFLLTKIKRDEN